MQKHFLRKLQFPKMRNGKVEKKYYIKTDLKVAEKIHPKIENKEPFSSVLFHAKIGQYSGFYHIKSYQP